MWLKILRMLLALFTLYSVVTNDGPNWLVALVAWVGGIMTCILYVNSLEDRDRKWIDKFTSKFKTDRSNDDWDVNRNRSVYDGFVPEEKE